MTPSSNTPPDGDFARYVEDLTRRNALAAPRPDMMKPPEGAAASVPLPSPAGPSTRPVPAPSPDRPAWPQLSLATHLKWVLAAWVGTQLLARMVPWAGFLFVPALLAYGAWVMFRVQPPAAAALKHYFLEMAESARKAPAARKPPHP